MMPIPVAGLLGTVVGAGIRFVIKRPITSAAGAIIGYEILDGDGIPDFEQDFGFKPHYMYDCKTGQQFFARTLTDHNNYTALGYVHDMSECDMNGGGENGGGGGNGMEVEGGILNTAGIFVVGAAKGTLIATIPILSMAVAVGFMKRIVRMGTGVGQ